MRSRMQQIFLQPSAAARFLQPQVDISQEWVDVLTSQQKRDGFVYDLRKWACAFAAECE